MTDDEKSYEAQAPLTTRQGHPVYDNQNCSPG